jgi:hypothetical protein
MAAEASSAISHVTTAGVVVFAINWLKRSSLFPWITAERTKLLRVLAVAGAGIGALGIHVAWNADAHSLTLTGLSLVSILTLGAAWLKSFVTQEVIYQATNKNGFAETVKQILTLLKANPSLTDSANAVAPAVKVP